MNTRGGRRATRVLAAAALTAVLCVALAGCGIPVDPDGTLDRVTGGELRAGASPSGTTVVIDGDDVSGPLPQLIEEFAAEHDAEVTWTVGSEEDLVDGLENGELDVAIGGMTDQTLWSDRASVTRAFQGREGADSRGFVALVPLGENGLQSALERFFDREVSG